MSRFWVIWIPLYGAVIAAVVFGLWYARRQAEAIYQTPQAIADWQKWVREAERQERGEGPVRRRAPKVQEPPAAILMRDYFGVCLAGAIALSSALYWSLAVMIHGALFAGRTPSDKQTQQDPS
jgi:hypothetical protein